MRNASMRRSWRIAMPACRPGAVTVHPPGCSSAIGCQRIRAWRTCEIYGSGRRRHTRRVATPSGPFGPSCGSRLQVDGVTLGAVPRPRRHWIHTYIYGRSRPLQAPSDRIRTAGVARWDAVAGLEAQWSALLARCPRHSVFQTHAWQLCWWKAFHAGHELFLILAHLDAELVGVAPFMVARRKDSLGRSRSDVHFIGSTNGAADYCDLITDPAIAGVAEALLD